jgi:copper chaperone CopZ
MTALRTTTQRAGTIERASFRVESHCRQCAASLEEALRSTDGVRFALVLPVSGETVVDYDPTLMTPRDLQDAIEAGGSRVEYLATRPVVAKQ